MDQHYNYEEYLQHYGVLGMKWGVRRGRTQQAYAKASKKLKKLETKVDKAQAKARKASSKADRKQYGMFTNEKKAAKSRAKANKQLYKAAKKMKKASKWVNSMEKSFKGTDVKLTAEQQALGRKYVDQLNMRSEMRSLMY